MSVIPETIRLVEGLSGEREERILTGERALSRAVELLAGGAILAHPTSTVYGLGGRVRDDVGREIARLKGREASRPLIRVAASLSELEAELGNARWNAVARRLASRFWPGPLTIVLDDETETGVAVRVDSHPLLRAVLERSGGLMTSTSLNRSGLDPVRSGQGALDLLREIGGGDIPVAVLDGGELSPGPASTIVSVRDGVSVLRSGAITRRDIEDAIRDGSAPEPV